MNVIRRVYVEKKPGYDVESRHLLEDLRHNLGLGSLAGLRILHRYDVDHVSEEAYRQALQTIFAEPPVDILVEEEAVLGEDETMFGIEYLPGQYDQRADSCEQCIQILNPAEKPLVRAARMVVLKGDLDEEAVEAVKRYCINPVDSREADLAKPSTLELVYEMPESVETVDGFVDLDPAGVEVLWKRLGLAMSMEDLLFTQAYFRDTEKRNPTLTEIRVLDTYWSDHCRHTTFLTRIDKVAFEPGKYNEPAQRTYAKYLADREAVLGEKAGEKDICLMDMALLAMRKLRKEGKLADLEVSEEINACSIVVPVDVDGQKEEWLVMFKNETHNHPTEIEPFGGAATCLGGAIRDPLSGRSYVYQAMRVTGAADPTVPVEETLPGKLPQRKIVTESAHGYSSYGNQIGLATGQVQEIYHPGYVAKRMEIGAVIAAAPRKNVVRETSDPGDIIVLLGGRTGRDGCGGATGSSKEHTEESIHTCGAEVQKGNPPTERKIQRLFRNPEVSTMIKKCNDFGAGGVSVAIGELADGLVIDLDAVPKKYAGLDGTELAISESQERMAVVLDPKDVDAFIRKVEEENLEATVVARVTPQKRLVMEWKDQRIVDISREFLDTNGATASTEVLVEAPKETSHFQATALQPAQEAELKSHWLEVLGDLNVCSQKGLVERFDSSIGAGSVLMPFGGKHQATPTQGMVGKIPLLEGKTNTGTAMSFGYNPDLSSWSPFHGAVYAVVESVAKIVAMGGDYRGIRFTFQEYFKRLGNDSRRWGEPTSALLGAYYAQDKLDLPSIGGKDSMSGTFHDIDVPPTLVSFAVDVVDVRKVVSPELKKTGTKLVWISVPRDSHDLPDFTALKLQYGQIHSLVEQGKVLSAYALGTGGLAAAVTKMAFGNGIGVHLAPSLFERELFAENYGDVVFELDARSAVECDELLAGVPYVIAGTTTEAPEIRYKDMVLDLEEARKVWEARLEPVFPSTAPQETGETLDLLHEGKQVHICRSKVANPHVFIPVFPGTNCEYDSARAFREAGATVETMVFRNLTPSQIEESLREMRQGIGRSQIVMVPGGFSAGDEPEGSGKFIATVFRNSGVKDAVMELLQARDGLMIGICNGFQALIKLGLVPYGEILEQDAAAPTLTYNTIGRHVSGMATTKVMSNKSPWLRHVKPGDIHAIPISHGEGRFAASPEVARRLFENGQVATTYVDPEGRPTMDSRFNPNGSVFAIEGITSPDGRVLGKMGHSERIGSHVAVNIAGNQNQKIFLSGVEYFK
ncbi:phosphoribosylformylglycinamidine synthase [Anaerotalea alkaliphila]|uniref:Phosphoribosylformylglycinamidine synthase n=1 Tax=Anaerotalea alkaliphila TaxID=2662126 RepID=A0A7X5HVE8_9FIRM|nr:phosphoribosylformylglycinamidine synthase [Anaerotalea alkaliphila]NDL67363.1 phosphoribosylformylglycinamidine synthase [Anaerotalea alkaliphila]